MNCIVDFKIINDRGELKLGLGTDVNSEKYTLFWNEFSISMTIRIGRGFLLLGMTILLKSGSRWEEFLWRGLDQSPISQPFCPKHLYATASLGTRFHFHWFLFNIFITTGGRAYSRMNFQMMNWDELNDFLERYQCRKVVNDKNISKVTLKISKQELVQKPHLMIVALHSFIKQLPKNSLFQSVPVIEVLYDSRKRP